MKKLLLVILSTALLSACSSATVPVPTPTPTPSPTDTIRLFFSLINDQKISEAVNLMADSITQDDSLKQSWGVQLNAFKQVSLASLSPAGDNLYQATLNVTMKPESATNPIPYFGYTPGQNIRWVSLEKSDNTWKITGIATSP